MKKKEKEDPAKKAHFSTLQIAAVAVTIVVVCVAIFSPKESGRQVPETHRAETATNENPEPKKFRIIWTKHPLPPRESGDIVGETFGRLDKALDLMVAEGKEDANLIRLINRYRESAPSRDQVDGDLKKLAGLKLTFIGQYHEEMGSRNNPEIVRIQSDIAGIILQEYDVHWAEDFCGNIPVTRENAWKEAQTEYLESDLPELRALADEQSTKKFLMEDTPMKSSLQLLFNPEFKGEVRGADYRELKSIQQHLLEYPLWKRLHGHPPSKLDLERFGPELRSALSSARNLFIMREIAQHADQNKRNVLVLGMAHTGHIGKIMAHYGVNGIQIVPSVTKQ